jgi:hypothetical protein
LEGNETPSCTQEQFQPESPFSASIEQYAFSSVTGLSKIDSCLGNRLGIKLNPCAAGWILGVFEIVQPEELRDTVPPVASCRGLARYMNS